MILLVGNATGKTFLAINVDEEPTWQERIVCNPVVVDVELLEPTLEVLEQTVLLVPVLRISVQIV